ncbi:MAG: MFS transporter [Novosphingobium sp.]|nr:MFS transporter [Novosphingobium sp.]
MSADDAFQEWRRHWPVVLPCFLSIMLISTHGYSLGVMIRPLEQEFGWPRAQISAGLLIISVLALFAGPVIGTLVDRFGARRIGLSGILFYCASLAGLSLANSNILSWWGLWFIVALGALTIMPMVWLSVLNGYFFKSRGLVLAIALSGTGLGAAIWPMLANGLVEAQGWRMAYIGMGAIGAMVCFPIAWLLFREHPSHRRSENRAEPDRVSPASSAAKHQMASMRFFKLAAAALLFAVANGTVTQNMVPLLLSEGLSPAKAAATAGLLGIGSIIGRVVGGFLLDRFNGNIVAAVSVILPLITVAILMDMDQSQFLAGVACLVMGFAIGAELDCCAYLTGRHFGIRNFPTLFGTINGLLLFGTGVAPVLANLVFDATRSYDLVLITLIPSFLLIALIFLSLGSYRNLDPETGEEIANLRA